MVLLLTRKDAVAGPAPAHPAFAAARANAYQAVANTIAVAAAAVRTESPASLLPLSHCPCLCVRSWLSSRCSSRAARWRWRPCGRSWTTRGRCGGRGPGRPGCVRAVHVRPLCIRLGKRGERVLDARKGWARELQPKELDTAAAVPGVGVLHRRVWCRLGSTPSDP